MHWETVAAALDEPSRVIPDRRPDHAPDFFLLPEPPSPVPMLAVGSGGQSVDWIARHSIGWMTYHREPQTQRTRHSMWRAAVDRLPEPVFRAFGVAMRLDLSDDPPEGATPLPLGYRSGRHALVELLGEMRTNGTHHVSLNLNSDRPVREVLQELATEVLPHFHA